MISEPSPVQKYQKVFLKFIILGAIVVDEMVENTVRNRPQEED